MKKTYPILLGLLLLATPAQVQAQFDYTDNGDGTCTITGYSGPGGAVTIPTNINGLTVTGIAGVGGATVFGADDNVTSVTIPGSVTDIAEYSFWQCGMTSLTIFNGSGPTGIGYAAFSGCTNLANLTIGNGVTFIGEFVFAGCSSLTSVTIPASVANMENAAFENCTSLTNATILGSSIGPGAFQDCTNLTNVTISGSVTSIGLGTFLDCYSLTSFTIPGSVTNLGEWAFNYCGLTSVTIPDSVTYIGEGAFNYCNNLTNVTFANGITDIGPGAFEDCTNLTNVTIPGSVTNIEYLAFGGDTRLTSVTIPASVNSIGNEAFYRCTNLTYVCFEGNAPSDGGNIFGFDPVSTIYYVNGTTGWGTKFSGVQTAPCVQCAGYLPPGTPSFSGNPVLQTGGVFSAQVTATPGMILSLQLSTNLTCWQTLQTFTNTANSSTITDSTANQRPASYYRLLLLGYETEVIIFDENFDGGYTGAFSTSSYSGGSPTDCTNFVMASGGNPNGCWYETMTATTGGDYYAGWVQLMTVSGNTDTNPANYVLSFDAYGSQAANIYFMIQTWPGNDFGGSGPVINAIVNDLLTAPNTWQTFSVNLGSITSAIPTGATWQLGFQLCAWQWGGPGLTDALKIDNITLVHLVGQ